MIRRPFFLLFFAFAGELFGACPSPTNTAGFLNPSGRINNFTTLSTDDCTLISADYGNLRVQTGNTLTVNGTLTFLGDFTINGTLILNGTLHVTGSLSLNGSLVNNGDAEIDQDLVVDWGGQTELNSGSSLDVGGNVDNGGVFSIIFGLDPTGTVDGVFTVAGDFYNNLNGSLSVGDGGLLDVGGDYVADPGSALTVQDGGTFMASNVSDPGGTITSPAGDSCDDGCCGSACGTLPVELISFDGFHDGTSVVLRWKTASETNNDYFEIQRSVNGAEFHGVEMVEGHGNSEIPISYSYTDTGVEAGSYYYRLKQVDFDGRFEYHQTIYMTTGTAESRQLSVYPNPFGGGALKIALAGRPASTPVQLSIYNLNGELVLDRELRPESSNWSLPDIGSSLQTGYYVLVLDDGIETYSERLLVH